jgi:hypothetical protein
MAESLRLSAPEQMPSAGHSTWLKPGLLGFGLIEILEELGVRFNHKDIVFT